jgi:hypothetical protein
MSGSKISGLPTAGPLTGNELVPAVQGADNVSVSTGQIANLVANTATVASAQAQAAAANAANIASSIATAAQVISGNNTGVIIPAYFYPNNPYTDPTYQAFLQSIRSYHKVPIMVILNPGNPGGPGTVWDGNWAAAITLLNAAGAITLGYVDTAFGARAPSDVLADIATWASMYGATPVQGIFFDEMPYDPGVGNANITLYSGYYNAAHAAGFTIVVANPGSDQQGVWYGSPIVADVICTWENSSWPPEATLQGNFVGGHSNYSWKRNAVLVYNQASFDAVNFAMSQKYARWIYSNTFNLPNPWGGLPSYLNTLLAAC